jgi:Fe/S biogenesis protein NfuA
MAAMTLRAGIERILKEAIPELAEIVDVTDHAAGENPYYHAAH